MFSNRVRHALDWFHTDLDLAFELFPWGICVIFNAEWTDAEK